MGEGRTRRGRALPVVGFQLSALCLVFLLTSSILTAATWCTIEVDVSDGQARALGDVDIRADASALFGARSLVTRSDGTAVLLGLPAGFYRLEISRVGYQWLEVQDVRCEPCGVVRLVVTLEETEGDEVVVLPSGPSVDPESMAVGQLLPRVALDRMPRHDPPENGQIGVPPSFSGAGFRPVEAIAFEGIKSAGFSGGSGPELVAVPRSPETGTNGRVSVGIGGGLTADPTGTRGDVTGLEDFLRARASFGVQPADGDVGTFLSFETNAADLESRVELDEGVSGDERQRRRQWERQSALAYGVLGWRPAPDNRVDLRLRWGRERQTGAASSLHVMPDSPLPLGDWEHTDHSIKLGWNALVSDALLVRIGAGYSGSAVGWEPKSLGVMEQDQSPDGLWSDGRGNGIWAGDGGVAAFDQSVDDLVGEAGLEWSVGSGHRLGFEASWYREDRDLEYSEWTNDAGLGERRISLGPVAARWESLIPPEVSRGVQESRRVALGDVWRAGPGLTVIFELEGSVLDFDAAGSGPGYHMGLEDTLSPRMGLVWDFEGSGRSRAWVRWARFRQGPGEAVRWRMTGALDVETTFIGDDGSHWDRSPGLITVASDLEPSVIDETVFGVEYELLSHLVAGAAGTVRRTRGNLAILTEDGGQTFYLDTPSGETWSERLDSESLEGWAWLRKRLANGWQAEVLVGWRQSRGAWQGPPTVDPADLDREYLADVLSPAALEGAWGPLPDDRRWHLEMGGSWLFAAGPSLGGRLTYRSGAPVSRLGALADGFGLDRRFVETRGSAGRSPELWRLDLVGSWPFPVGRGQLEAYAELNNLFGSQTAVSLDQRWTLLDEVQADGLDPAEQRTTGTWREPFVVQRPMELIVGLAYTW